MDHVNIDHDASVPAVSPPASGVENNKNAKDMAIDELKTLLRPLLARLKKAKEAQPNRDEDWLWWFPIITVASGHNKLACGGKLKGSIASLASHVGITDDHFIELRKRAKLQYFRSWSKVLGISVICHKDGQMSWIVLDELHDGKQWSHLPRDQVLLSVKRPAWVWRARDGYVEGVVEEERVAAIGSRNNANKRREEEASRRQIEETRASNASRQGTRFRCVDHQI
eukprot:scaffold420309_cov35-Attheya_sp.AAC.1